MKYCLPFLINSQYKDTIDELYIQVYETSDILKLPAFLEQHQNQRVIIVIEDFEIITKDKFKVNVPKEIISKFYLGGLVYLIFEWLTNSNKYTKDDILSYLNILVPKLKNEAIQTSFFRLHFSNSSNNLIFSLGFKKA